MSYGTVRTVILYQIISVYMRILVCIVFLLAILIDLITYYPTSHIPPLSLSCTTTTTTTMATTSIIQQQQPRTEPSMLPSLLGTWTLETHASSDLGYYKASAFVVMHVMADPLSAYSCSLEGCDELKNQICQRNVDACVDMASSISQWSDVSIFYQFGFDVLSGTYPWRTHVVQNTSDWLGPYPMVLPQHGSSTHAQLKSRYVTTVSTDYLQPPVNYTLTPPSLFDQYAGATAVHNSIAQQTHLQTTDDPYKAQLETCAHGDIHPILPRVELHKQHKSSVGLDLDFLLLSLPEANDRNSLYKVWPAVQKHLPDFPVAGPYCFQGDPHRAYAVNVSFPSTTSTGGGANNPWKLTPGCVADLPCWHTEHPPKPHGGGGSPSGDGGMIWKLLTTYGVYFVLVGLMISMTINCQLSYQLQQQQRARGGDQEEQHGRRRRRVVSSAAAETNRQEELQEPLLTSAANEEDPATIGAPGTSTSTSTTGDEQKPTTTADIGGEAPPPEETVAAKGEQQV